jgi:hypothetical protein
MSVQADTEEKGKKGAVARTRRTEETENIGDIGPSGRGAERGMTITSKREGIARCTKQQYRGRRDTSRTSLEQYSSHVVTISHPTCAGRYGPSTIKSLIETT